MKYLFVFSALGSTLAVVMITAVSYVNVHPKLVGPYIERRAAGHNPLIVTTARTVARLLAWFDRGNEMPLLELPGWTSAIVAPDDADLPTAGALPVFTDQQLRAAMRHARPGDVIELAPVTFHVGKSLHTRHGGTVAAPIIVRGHQSGGTRLESATTQAFYVTAPNWRFEKLEITGVCSVHARCEHAIHVVGNASNVVIHGNVLTEFNAAIKVNKDKRGVPDHGRISNNRIFNRMPRRTANPVASIDIVAASDWTISHNLIADFIKAGGDRVSYGAYAKGAGERVLFTDNVVLCEARLRGLAGRRVGISLGGGGTGKPYCRDNTCIYEHVDGVIRGNIVASCSDEGIYLNSATRSRVEQNTILNTGGVSLRFPATTAVVRGNLIDGPVRVREDAGIEATDNEVPWLPLLYLGVSTARDYYRNPAQLDLGWRSRPPAVPIEFRGKDLCGAQRANTATVGAFEDIDDCTARR